MKSGAESGQTYLINVQKEETMWYNKIAIDSHDFVKPREQDQWIWQLLTIGSISC